MGDSRMNKKELREEWDSIARALGRIINRAQELPECEQDSQFNEQLEYAFCHAHRMYRIEDSRVDYEDLSRRWAYIAKDLARIMKRAERLVKGGRRSRFNEKLNDAFWHADSRADALIDPC